MHCIGSTGGLCVSRQESNGYFVLMSDRMNRRYPAKRHRFFRWYADFQLTVGATATRLGGLYIRLTPAIGRLLELLDIPHTPKNISKPYKSIKIISLALSTL